MRIAVARLIVALLVLPAALAVMAGCGKKEEETPTVSGGTYYTGPMKPKGAGAGAQTGSQQPP